MGLCLYMLLYDLGICIITEPRKLQECHVQIIGKKTHYYINTLLRQLMKGPWFFYWEIRHLGPHVGQISEKINHYWALIKEIIFPFEGFSQVT